MHKTSTSRYFLFAVSLARNRAFATFSFPPSPGIVCRHFIVRRQQYFNDIDFQLIWKCEQMQNFFPIALMTSESAFRVVPSNMVLWNVSRLHVFCLLMLREKLRWDTRFIHNNRRIRILHTRLLYIPRVYTQCKTVEILLQYAKHHFWSLKKKKSHMQNTTSMRDFITYAS